MSACPYHLHEFPYISLRPSAVIPGCEPTSSPWTEKFQVVPFYRRALIHSIPKKLQNFFQLIDCRLNARLEWRPFRWRQETSTAMVFDSEDSSRFFQRAHHAATESAFVLLVVKNSTSLLPGHGPALGRHISYDLHGQQFHRP